MSQAPFVDIALGIPQSSPYQYGVPDILSDKVDIGKRVYVKIRERRMVGYIVGFSHAKAVQEIKDIDSVIDALPVLAPHMLKLTQWMADTYVCSRGQCIEAVLPAAFKKGKITMKSRSAKTGESAQSVNPDDLKLTAEQEAAYGVMIQPVEQNESRTFLLHGITGSGKTEVYMHVIREVLKKGKSCIVLVPEISLTPQSVDRFYSRFGDCVAVIHSRLSQGRKMEEWHRIRSGEAKVVVGARSAIFSPTPNLGLIVIDEEHETSYKQDETPRYDARRVARERAKNEKAVLILGSATPSMETFHEAQTNQIGYVYLSNRIENRPLPVVDIVDMRRQRDVKRERIFSQPLEEAIKQVLVKKEQVMLLLNRRGFSTHLHCASCGYVMSCPNCRISLAYHFDTASVMCHVCHHTAVPQRLCPGCQKNYLHYFGIGTQKVEQEAKMLFSSARIARMDTDSTSRKDAHEQILRAFQKQQLDILIGTQMIAKGHDFPNVSLIGVVSADTALHIPDFRASERTFDILTQVAGRAGRGDVPGRVIIQTSVPHHYAIQSAKDHNFLEFYDKEIILRKELMMPPFSRLIQIIGKGPDEGSLLKQMMLLAKELGLRTQSTAIQVLGPAPSLVSKAQGSFFWHLYVKGSDIEAMISLVRKTLGEFRRGSVQLTVDVDPQ
jgi:primosomal protein N' (replication factor Y)